MKSGKSARVRSLALTLGRKETLGAGIPIEAVYLGLLVLSSASIPSYDRSRKSKARHAWVARHSIQLLVEEVFDTVTQPY